MGFWKKDRKPKHNKKKETDRQREGYETAKQSIKLSRCLNCRQEVLYLKNNIAKNVTSCTQEECSPVKRPPKGVRWRGTYLTNSSKLDTQLFGFCISK